MPRSPFFVRIKSEVIDAVRSIPPGRVATYAEIGDVLDVPARHVAYVLATLDPAEEPTVPWHRTTGEGGALSKASSVRRSVQTERLRAEGVGVLRGRVVGFEEIALRPDLPPGALGRRPDDTPAAGARRGSRKVLA